MSGCKNNWKAVFFELCLKCYKLIVRDPLSNPPMLKHCWPDIITNCIDDVIAKYNGQVTDNKYVYGWCVPAVCDYASENQNQIFREWKAYRTGHEWQK